MYDLSESQFVASTQLRTLRRSSLCTMAAPYLVRVKVEPADDDVIEFSESSNGDIPTQSPPIPHSVRRRCPTLLVPIEHFIPHPPLTQGHLNALLTVYGG